jgi:hypothetical protein
MSGPERRLYRRYRTVLRVRVRWKQGEWLRGESRDVSAGGVFVEVQPILPPVGEVVEVVISVLGLAEIGARGPVMYRVPGVGVGIHFLEMSFASQKQLRDLVQVLEAREDRTPR